MTIIPAVIVPKAYDALLYTGDVLQVAIPLYSTCASCVRQPVIISDAVATTCVLTVRQTSAVVILSRRELMNVETQRRRRCAIADSRQLRCDAAAVLSVMRSASEAASGARQSHAARSVRHSSMRGTASPVRPSARFCAQQTVLSNQMGFVFGSVFLMIMVRFCSGSEYF